MEKRSRNRLIIVTAIILALLGTLLYVGLRGNSLAYFKTVTELKNDTSLIGKSVKVGGKVVADSIKKSGTEVTFTLSDTKSKIKISYKGALPSTFGENVQVIAVGIYKSENLVKADSLVTKCPSKYENKKIETK